MKKFLALLLAVTMAVSLFGCGSSQTSTNTQTETKTEAKAEETKPAEEAKSAEAAKPAEAAPAGEIDLGEENTAHKVYRLPEVEATALMDGTVPEVVEFGPLEYEGTLKVGFSQMEVNNNWRIVENRSIEQACQAAGWDLEYRDAESSSEKQNRDIMDLVDADCDIIIVAPYEVTGMRAGLEYAEKAGIPVVLIDRTTDGPHLTNCMGDFILAGYLMAKSVREAFGEGVDVKILQIHGGEGASYAMDTEKGFRMFMEEDGHMEILATGDGKSTQDTSLEVAENLIQANRGKFNCIVTHLDDAALGSIQALKDAGYTPGTDVANGEIFVTGQCGYSYGFEAMMAGEEGCDVECTARFGPVVYDIINRILEGGSIAKRLVMPCMVYTAENCADYIQDAL